jgi:hypothetical protein
LTCSAAEAVLAVLQPEAAFAEHAVDLRFGALDDGASRVLRNQCSQGVMSMRCVYGRRRSAGAFSKCW